MTSIGETLRDERRRRNLDIHQISRELKIPVKFLEAIEEEQFEKLPAAVFAKSFVRQYARALGLHEDELTDALRNVLEPPTALPEPPPERSVSPAIQVDPMAEWERVGERKSWSSSLPALAMVVVVMMACSGVYAWWQRSRRPATEQSAATPAAQAQRTTPAPEQTAPPAPAKAETPAPASGSTNSSPQPASSTGQGAAAIANPKPTSTGTTGASGSAEPASTGTTSAATSATPPDPATAPSANTASESTGATTAPTPPQTPGPVHVEITASDSVWIFAKADGKTAFTGTLEANQSRTIDATGEVVLRLGNAAGAQITLNGKPIGQIGAKGQARTIQLTSGGFHIVAPPKPDLLDPLR
jgi:cytoskeleton protein RodZ